MNRRRFLALTAGMALAGTGAQGSTTWTGRALGAEAELTLSGDRDAITAALTALPTLLRRIETEFSLYDPRSALSRLNQTGRLEHPSQDFTALIALSDQINRATAGAFDPTVQPLWLAHASGQPCRAPIGWHRVTQSPLSLQPGMALTFNGIAQGFATDAARALLAGLGFDHVLINIGEHAALGGPFQLGLSDPSFGLLARRSLTNRAMATSSPRATQVNGHPHLMHPRGLPPLWSSVTVEADLAAMADALSTALVFLDAETIRALALPGLHHVHTISFTGDFQTLI